MQGDFEQAQRFQKESLIISRESGNRSQETYALINLGAMLISQGNFRDALEVMKQALNLARAIKELSAEAWALTHLGYASLGVGDLENAILRFEEALGIRNSLGQQSLAMEPIAGLAQVELSQDNPVIALQLIEKILSHLTKGDNLEGTEEPLRIYLTIYLTLMKNHDPRANKILENAYSLLQDQVSKIKDQTLKDMFIQNVPWRREIEEHWRQNQVN
jgi:tetratricopeptide (TPR) repeat protein